MPLRIILLKVNFFLKINYFSIWIKWHFFRRGIRKEKVWDKMRWKEYLRICCYKRKKKPFFECIFFSTINKYIYELLLYFIFHSFAVLACIFSLCILEKDVSDENTDLHYYFFVINLNILIRQNKKLSI